MTMIFIYIAIAIFIAWIWVDYFRLIDIYEKDKLIYFVITFLLGCGSVFVVYGIHYAFLDYTGFQLNGTFFNDFLYCFAGIGMVEELAKLIPFAIMLLIFRKQINEPVDYLAYISTAALGFAAVENVQYFIKDGYMAINGRSILSTVGHMFDSSIIAYGIILFKFRKYNRGIPLLFFFLAAFAHGFYDFWLVYPGIGHLLGALITILYFLFTISLFAVILNNALNNSSFFSYKKVIDSGNVSTHLIINYLIVFILQFAIHAYFDDLKIAMRLFFGSIITVGFIVLVTSLRLSRFKLIKDRWFPLKFELPFRVLQGEPYGITGTFIKIGVKGDSYNEVAVNIYYEEYFHLCPLSPRISHLEYTRLAFYEKKLFYKNDEAFILAKVYDSDIDKNSSFERMLLKPKTTGTTMYKEKFPIVAVLKIDHLEEIENNKHSFSDFKFVEWGVIMPIPE